MLNLSNTYTTAWNEMHRFINSVYMFMLITFNLNIKYWSDFDLLDF